MDPSNELPDSTVEIVESEAPQENVVDVAVSNYEWTIQHCQDLYVSEFEKRDSELWEHARISAQTKSTLTELKEVTKLHLTTSKSNKNLQESVLNLEAEEKELQEDIETSGIYMSPEDIGVLIAAVQELRQVRHRHHQENEI